MQITVEQQRITIYQSLYFQCLGVISRMCAGLSRYTLTTFNTESASVYLSVCVCFTSLSLSTQMVRAHGGPHTDWVSFEVSAFLKALLIINSQPNE